MFTELVANSFVLPNLVSTEQEAPEKCLLKIKGDYDSQKIESLLKDRGLLVENNKQLSNYLQAIVQVFCIAQERNSSFYIFSAI